MLRKIVRWYKRLLYCEVCGNRIGSTHGCSTCDAHDREMKTFQL